MAMRAATTSMAAMVAAAAKPRGLSRALFSSLTPDFQFSPSQEANELQSVTADSSPVTSTPTRTSNFSFTPPQPALESQRVMADPSTNLFVSGLSKRTTDEGLRDAFAKFGEVVQARVVKDRNSGYSKGFGFVNYSSLEGPAAGIEGMDGKTVVASIASDPNVWYALLQNKELLDYIESQKTSTVAFEDINASVNGSVADAESPKCSDESHESKGSESGGGIMDYLENIRVQVVDMMNSLSDTILNFFGGPMGGESSANADGSGKVTFVDKALGASFMLAVMVIMVVVLKRG